MDQNQGWLLKGSESCDSPWMVQRTWTGLLHCPSSPRNVLEEGRGWLWATGYRDIGTEWKRETEADITSPRHPVSDGLILLWESRVVPSWARGDTDLVQESSGSLGELHVYLCDPLLRWVILACVESFINARGAVTNFILRKWSEEGTTSSPLGWSNQPVQVGS